MKVAVIGSGAAALGVLDRLSQLRGSIEITLIEKGLDPDLTPTLAPSDWSTENIAALYRISKSRFGYGFPPPKTNFGAASPRRMVDGWGRVWDSAGRGGLTTLWGLSALPFSSRDMKGWPITAEDLAPHYAAIAARVGISGQRDALSDSLNENFGYLPPIPTPLLIRDLANSINSSSSDRPYAFVAGHSRLALETRSGKDHACVACGECMLGCPKGAMYSSNSQIEQWRDDGLISSAIEARATAVDTNTRSVTILDATGHRSVLGPFDRIYVCAGCINTTEIAMRSLGLTEGPQIVDNSVYTIPIAYLGTSHTDEPHLALTNLLISAVPRDMNAPSAQLQVYLIFDHLWRYYLPPSLWPIFSRLGRLARQRLLLVRAFLDGSVSQRYNVQVHGENPAKLTLVHQGTPLKDVPDLLPDMTHVLNRGRFRTLPLPVTRQKTSSHYAASMPMGSTFVGLDGSIAPGVYLCDSATFPTAPAASPTFTIMANARRIADESLQ